MTVINLHTLQIEKPSASTVLCLGNFDGVHMGHRALAKETVRRKDELSEKFSDLKSGAWFFGRAPIEVITGKPQPHITDFEQKLAIFAELGLDYAFVYDYEEIGGYSPEKFVFDVLKKECGCVFAVCGYNFKFGKGAAGDAALLSCLMDGNAAIIDKVSHNGQHVSSSEIRKLIADGDMELANGLLGRNHFICNEVVHGKHLGRRLGIPTINQKIPDGFATPKKGIYISRTLIDGKYYASVSNVGFRPSVEDTAFMNCETYIIGFEGDLYGQKIKVEFLKRLRDEKKFDSIEELKAQILTDIEQTKEYFRQKQEA